MKKNSKHSIPARLTAAVLAACLGLAVGTAIKKKDPPGPTLPPEGGAEG